MIQRNEDKIYNLTNQNQHVKNLLKEKYYKTSLNATIPENTVL